MADISRKASEYESRLMQLTQEIDRLNSVLRTKSAD